MIWQFDARSDGVRKLIYLDEAGNEIAPPEEFPLSVHERERGLRRPGRHCRLCPSRCRAASFRELRADHARRRCKLSFPRKNARWQRTRSS